MNKYAFITGASRGIGREAALSFAKRGYDVFLSGRDKKALLEVADAVKNIGQTPTIIELDLTKLEDIKQAAQVVKQTTSHLDVLANIAGMYHNEKQHFFGIPFEEYPDDAIVQNIMGILVGHILLTKYLISLMDNTSSIINMSGSFDEGETGVISDFMTKKGIELFTKQLPLEIHERGIRANALSPGFVYTENVKKFFPDVNEEDTLSPVYVAEKIVETAEDKSLNGQIIELKK